MVKPLLITGASSGIGYELARVGAAHNHDLILVARRADRLQALQQELTNRWGVQVWIYVADLTDAQARQQLFDWSQDQAIRLYGLVNNAGFGHQDPLAEANWERQNAMLQLNIVALTHLTRLYLPGLIAQGQGRILNVASTAAFLPGPYMAVYFASKAYVRSFTTAIASELQGTGVTATTLCPGPTRSEFQEQAGVSNSKLFQGELPSAAEVAAYGYTAMEQGQAIAVHGFMNQVLTQLARLLPYEGLAEQIKTLQKDG
ncbi:MAG: SDR family oxidoreductase [Cyanobacteria bacterium REEB459]|nr:SDR family oxidoreductase [Cyanobacteria bacterium REEB459]